MSKADTPLTTTDEKMDEIVRLLRRMDKRDSLRAIGGTVRFILALIPIIILLWSVWYAVENWQELLKSVADQAASSAAKMTQEQGNSLYERLIEQAQGR